MSFDVPLPNPVPSDGVALVVPSTPATVGPFTATSADISVTESPVSNTTDIDGDGIGEITRAARTTRTTRCRRASPTAPPGPAHLAGHRHCGPGHPAPAPPAADRALRAVLPAHPGRGPRAQRRGHHRLGLAPEPLGRPAVQRHGLPDPHPASRRAGVRRRRAGQRQLQRPGRQRRRRLRGVAGPGVDGVDDLRRGHPEPGAEPRASGVDFPTTPITVGPFTASGGPITIAAGPVDMVVAALSSKAFTMSCTAYPNDSEPTSGSTGTPPTAPPIRPMIATATASGSLPTTTTLPPTTAAGHRHRARTSCTARAARGQPGAQRHHHHGARSRRRR